MILLINMKSNAPPFPKRTGPEVFVYITMDGQLYKARQIREGAAES